MNSMKRQKDRTVIDELPRAVDALYATREEWRNNSKNNEEMEPKQTQHPVMDVKGDGSKFLPVVFIPSCDSSSLAFHKMYSECK